MLYCDTLIWFMSVCLSVTFTWVIERFFECVGLTFWVKESLIVWYSLNDCMTVRVSASFPLWRVVYESVFECVFDNVNVWHCVIYSFYDSVYDDIYIFLNLLTYLHAFLILWVCDIICFTNSLRELLHVRHCKTEYLTKWLSLLLNIISL